MLITESISNYAKNQPGKMYTSYQGRDWTYSEFYEKAKRIAAYFQQKGYKKDDVIALYALNSDTFLVCYFGIQLGGFTVMPVNTKLAVPEVEYIFLNSKAKGLIYDVRIEEVIKGTSHEFQDILAIGGEDTVGQVIGDESLEFVLVTLEGEDTAVVMYTSGTTGKPKGVMLTHANIQACAEIWSEAMAITEQDRMLISTPLFHCAAAHVFVVPVTHKGGSLVIEEAFSPDKTMKMLESAKPTMFFGVPAMYSIILNLPDIQRVQLPSLRLFCYGAAPMPYELVKKLKETFPNVSVQNCYGQTENAPAASSLKDYFALDKIGSVGEVLPQTEIRVVDEFGEPLPAGQVGEIVVKGPQVMKGYLRNEEATRQAIKNGWLYSGDLGKFDEDGLLYIVDRKKDMIIRGGENVYPVEVEEVLYQIPELLEAAVVGVPHEVYGEVPKAYAVKKPGQDVSEKQIQAYCATKLAKYKVPLEVEFMEELPRNASGKVLKHTLRVPENSRG
ncbi:class I adenylate-forming enzyme family protein [Planococcus shenhongbingii]|uniref:Long-chain-fatty-acid--CoA ligase n=1 Tax=Planococcus shenhongbingii TaxID=3058398 RepID=A0ABT8NH51_9BACL|nr:long-chain-fatty-acid--CoA ligase [Planococcus sp. N017]MDN7246800.1 long-chain-fatty-acid--CoA ligase [Planococcus sp. N017]